MKKTNISEVPFKHGTYGSKYLFNEPGFTGGYAKLTPGSAIDPHVHDGETEVFYFMAGSPLVKTGNQSFRPLQGDGLTVSAGEIHSIINDTDFDAEMVFIKIKG